MQEYTKVTLYLAYIKNDASKFANK